MKKIKLCLIIVLSLAALLRFWRLDKFPPSLFGDEVDVGYQAYSLLKTGRDIKGNFLPTYLDSLAEPRAPLLMYVTAPFLKVFGVNEWGVRTVPAFFGVLSVFLVFALVQAVFNDQVLALTAAFLIAITPWHLTYSRAAFEVSLLLFLILSGTLFFLKALKKNIFWLPVSAVSFGLSFYTYNTANIFVPLWLITLILFYRKDLAKIWLKFSRQIIFSLLLGLFIVFPLVNQILHGSAASRFKLVSIFSDPKVIDTIVFKRSIAAPGSIPERIFHNKIVYWVKSFSSNYLESLSFKFLFVSGDPNPRQTIPGIGLLFLSFVFPLLLGIYQSIKERQKSGQLIVNWLVIAPIASCLTTDGGNHATRLILMLPPLIILISIGIALMRKTKLGRYFLVILSVCLLFELSFYLHEMVVHYPKEQSRYWQYGYKEAVSLYKENKGLCDKLYVNNTHDPFLIRYLFWTQTDPAWFRQNFNGDKENQVVQNIFLSFKLGNSYFGRIVVPDNFQAMKDLLSDGKSCYLAFQGDEVPGDFDLRKNPQSGLKVLGVVEDPWGKPYIYLLHF